MSEVFVGLARGDVLEIVSPTRLPSWRRINNLRPMRIRNFKAFDAADMILRVRIKELCAPAR